VGVWDRSVIKHGKMLTERILEEDAWGEDE